MVYLVSNEQRVWAGVVGQSWYMDSMLIALAFRDDQRDQGAHLLMLHATDELTLLSGIEVKAKAGHKDA